MILWIACAFFLFLGITKTDWQYFRRQRKVQDLKKVVSSFHEFQESIEAGLVPSEERWRELSQLQAPWGNLASQSVVTLRENGAAILPTLRRLRSLAEHTDVQWMRARSRTAQALTQATVCGCLVPALALMLQQLMPGLSEHRVEWWTVSALALFLVIVGASWMFRISDSAAWAGLPPKRRPWVLSHQCGAEFFLAQVRSGQPPDIAWTHVFELLDRHDPVHARLWGTSIWEPSPPQRKRASSAESILARFPHDLKNVIQVSLMDGKPCTETVESLLQAHRHEMDSAVTRSVELAATQALKPLFVCVAPAMLGLLGFSVFLIGSGL